MSDDILVRTPQHAAEDRRNGIIIILFMGLPMLAVGVAILWYVVVSMQNGHVDLDDGQGLLYRQDDPFAFHLSNLLTAAVGVFCAFMGLEIMLNGWRHARGVPGKAKGVSRMGARRR